MSDSRIAMVDLVNGYLAYREEIDAAVQRVLESGWYILGDEVSLFEKSFSGWCGTRHCVGVANGTDAINIALRALGVGRGDAVFTVSHTAVATIAAIELAGATPILVDIDIGSLTLDPVRLEQAVKEYLRSQTAGRPKAVVAVHLYGQACDLAAILSICVRYDLRLLEDCAQAHGTTLDGKRAGSFGDVSTFSFYPTKNLGAFGDGGAIVTSDDEIARNCRALRQYGWFQHYQSDIEGMNSRLDELQAAILRVRLRHLEDETMVRRRVAERYHGSLREFVIVPDTRSGAEHSYHLYVIRSHDRDAISLSLRERNIASAIHYPTPVHKQKAYQGRLPQGPGGLMVTERIAGEILSLPLHPFLSDSDIERVIAGVTNIAARHSGLEF